MTETLLYGPWNLVYAKPCTHGPRYQTLNINPYALYPSRDLRRLRILGVATQP